MVTLRVDPHYDQGIPIDPYIPLKQTKVLLIPDGKTPSPYNL